MKDDSVLTERAARALWIHSGGEACLWDGIGRGACRGWKSYMVSMRPLYLAKANAVLISIKEP